MTMNKILLAIVILLLALGAWIAFAEPFAVPTSNDDGEEDTTDEGNDDDNDEQEEADGKADDDPLLDAIEAKSNLIRVESPEPYEAVESPLFITGVARGTWYFEASFPVSLVDENGDVIASGIATAQDEWMTEAFVPFTATLIWSNTLAEPAFVILQKDNPSGLPEYDDELRIPVE